MKDELAILPEQAPDATDLELYLAGAVEDPSAREAIERAMEGPLAEELADMERARAAWKAIAHPPLTAQAPQVLESVAVPAPANRWRRGLLALASVAAVLIGVLLVPSPGDAPEVRAMGALPVATWVEREGREIASPTSHVQGDRVFLAFTAPREGYALVGLVPESGEPTLFWRAASEQRVERGERFVLDGALELDGASDREWIVVLFTESTLGFDEALDALSSVQSDPEGQARARGWWAQEVTRGR